MDTFERVKSFVGDFKELLKKYNLELTGFVEPCDEGSYRIWLKDVSEDAEYGYNFLNGDYGVVSIEEINKDEEFFKNSLEEEW